MPQGLFPASGVTHEREENDYEAAFFINETRPRLLVLGNIRTFTP